MIHFHALFFPDPHTGLRALPTSRKLNFSIYSEISLPTSRKLIARYNSSSQSILLSLEVRYTQLHYISLHQEHSLPDITQVFNQFRRYLSLHQENSLPDFQSILLSPAVRCKSNSYLIKDMINQNYITLLISSSFSELREMVHTRESKENRI
ncbi:hypothetical protein AMTRI_Chr06g196130 [Amborella trichopoda]